MILVNQTKQPVAYWISANGGSPECGNIDVNGIADLPRYDHQTNVYVGFKPTGPQKSITIELPDTGKGQAVELALVVQGKP
jgi:hypothetical protein